VKWDGAGGDRLDDFEKKNHLKVYGCFASNNFKIVLPLFLIYCRRLIFKK
jgi:hypothetical protein